MSSLTICNLNILYYIISNINGTSLIFTVLTEVCSPRVKNLLIGLKAETTSIRTIKTFQMFLGATDERAIRTSGFNDLKSSQYGSRCSLSLAAASPRSPASPLSSIHPNQQGMLCSLNIDNQIWFSRYDHIHCITIGMCPLVGGRETNVITYNTANVTSFILSNCSVLEVVNSPGIRAAQLLYVNS